MNTKQIKQTEAVVRNETWAKLTHKQQLASLDERLGKGIGAKKQRAKIQYKIDNPQIRGMINKISFLLKIEEL